MEIIRKKLLRTKTPIHSEEARRAVRDKAKTHENDVMISTLMGAQLLSMSALYLLPTVSTASWWSALLLIFPMLLLFVIGRAAAAEIPDKAAEKPVNRFIFGVFALLFLSDMAISLTSFIELSCTFVLTQGSRRTLSLIAALVLPWAAPKKRMASPARAAVFLRFFFILAFVFCAVTVLGQGERGFLYPIAGYGVLHSLKGTAFMCGGVWSMAALPLIAGKKREEKTLPLSALRPPMTVLILLVLLFLCCAYVLPGTALSSRFGYPIRLQMLMMISPSVLSWSLLLIAELLLFSASFAAAGACAVSCFQKAIRRRVPLTLLSLCCLPVAIRGMDALAGLLTALLPWRYPIALLLSLIALAVKEKKK